LTACGKVLAGPDGPNGESERGNGLSICTFSGLNDSPDDPEEGGQVQSYGQIVKVVGVAELKAEGETPADLCNPNHAPWGTDVWWRSTPNNVK
jgi:hypothetical protein